MLDLTKCGAYRYAKHPSTDINCFGWSIGEGDIDLWEPGDPIPEELIEAINSGELIAAWNAQFERLIWNYVLTRYGFPALPVDRFYCIAALSRARGYPGKLEKAAIFADLPMGKDMEGHYLMLKLCKPRKIEEDGTIVWWNDRDDYKRLGIYCKRDVEVERAMFHQFIPFTEQELADYHMAERINDRGVKVDLELAHAAVSGVQSEKITADDTIKALTGGEITACTQVQKITDWVEKEWRAIPDLGKQTINDLLLEDDIPPLVAEVLELRRDNSRAAVSKFNAMIERHVFGVIYGLFMFRGAGQTGRYSSIGLQLHNLLAECCPEAIPVLKKYGIAGLYMLGEPIKLLAQMVRPAFIAAAGRRFLIADFAQIEARITAWLAGEDSLLRVFREGKSPYSAFGKIVYGRDITKADHLEYLVSKGCVLGLGFGGAEGALARSMRKSGIILPGNELTDLVYTYRDTYTRIKKLWYALNAAVIAAMYSPGKIVEVSYVAYLFDGLHLYCRLPSGRLMCYPFAKLAQDEWGDYVYYRRGNRNPKSGATEWPTVKMWHGLEIENLAQAIAYDLLQGAMNRLEGEGFDIRLHVHDEIGAEEDMEIAEERMPEMIEIMTEVPEWATGLPLAAEGKISARYVK